MTEGWLNLSIVDINDCYKMIVKLTSLYKLRNIKMLQIWMSKQFFSGDFGRGFSPVSPLLRMPLLSAPVYHIPCSPCVLFLSTVLVMFGSAINRSCCVRISRRPLLGHCRWCVYLWFTDVFHCCCCVCCHWSTSQRAMFLKLRHNGRLTCVCYYCCCYY